jgi:hypothetical protein
MLTGVEAKRTPLRGLLVGAAGIGLALLGFLGADCAGVEDLLLISGPISRDARATPLSRVDHRKECRE